MWVHALNTHAPRNMDLSTLFHEEVAPSKRATRPSLRCRAFTNGTRCMNCKSQHDGTCWEHRDYYTGWWDRVRTTSIDDFWIMLLKKEKEIEFQLDGGFVDYTDAADAVHNSHIELFLYLCKRPTFRAADWPRVRVRAITYLTGRYMYGIDRWNTIFAPLIRHYPICYIFQESFQIVMGVQKWRKDFKYFLADTQVEYKDIFPIRRQLFECLDRHGDLTLKSEFLLWLAPLKEAERFVVEPLRQEIVAAGWAPERMPFWCLDLDEIAELYPEGLPSKEEHLAACVAAC